MYNAVLVSVRRIERDMSMTPKARLENLDTLTTTEKLPSCSVVAM
jgi:hypothetical protein